MDAVEDIKSRLSVEDVIGDYIELKRSGRNLKGLSPFSNEKTASFMVSPEKQIWHDFSSGKGGNMFSFIMEMEGLDFKGALELLARKSGVDLEQYRTSGNAERSSQKTKIYDCLEAAAKFYQVQFSQNKTALTYILKERGYSKDIALEFRIGYSPNNGRALLEFLKKKGFSEQIIKSAGLATARYSTASDMFRGRIMIPLQDALGRVIGFTARALDPNDTGPKYINTPATIVYDKGRHVYGLHLAKEAIRKLGFVVVVEGNLDVIASRAVGVNNVVATAGTAMTEMHLKELARFSQDIRLAFDQDSAGLSAMERVIPMASNVDVSLSIITVPDGKDPDELIKKNPNLWTESVKKYDYAIDWLIERHKDQLDMSSGSGKKALTDVILPIIAKLNDKVEQDHYITRLADMLQVDKQALVTKLGTKKTGFSNSRLKKGKAEVTTKIDAESLKTQNQFLALCLMHPEFREYLQSLNFDMFTDEQRQNAFNALKESKEPGTALLADEDYGKVLSVLYEEIYQNLEYVELQYEAARLQVRVVERYVKNQKASLSEKFRNAPSGERTELQNRDKELNDMLKINKGL